MAALAVLVIDMCGYRQLMAGSVAAADAAVVRLQEAATAATEHHGGRIVKFWADNVMSIFPEVEQAVAAAEATMALVPCAAGVGWGEIEDRGDDLVGLEVCDACGLGEDVAVGGQVLLTKAAKEELGAETGTSRPDARP